MEKVQKLTDQLETGITELFNSEQYAAYLSTMSKFHRYSFGNILLILLQCPGASQVAGYGDWKKNFGRQVKRGEHGIAILAPCPYRRQEEVEETAPDGSSSKSVQWVQRMSFRTVTVFDISQTEGKPLPEIAKKLTGDVAQYESTITYTTKLGTRSYTVTSVSKVLETDTSGTTASSDNRLTLYTCVRDQSAYRWMVCAVER